MSTEALTRAIKIAGGQTALARAIGTRQANIWSWLNRSGKVRPEFVLAIEKATGVPRYELRPDIYPPPSEEIPATSGKQPPRLPSAESEAA